MEQDINLNNENEYSNEFSFRKKINMDRTIHKSPSEEQYLALQSAYDYFNEILFNKKLKGVILSLSRDRNAFGAFRRNNWKKGHHSTHEISINPDYINREPVEVFSTLVHEMCHLFQAEYGSPSRRNYHNKEFALIMESVGLITSKTGEVGGKRIGDGMSHYVFPNGEFEIAFKKIPNNLLFPWENNWKNHRRKKSPIEVSIGSKELDKKDNRSKTKYTCPNCKKNVWGAGNLHIQCIDCEEEFEEMK